MKSFQGFVSLGFDLSGKSLWSDPLIFSCKISNKNIKDNHKTILRKNDIKK